MDKRILGGSQEKILQAVSERGMGKGEAARTSGLSLSSVKRYVKMAQEEGDRLCSKEEGWLEAQARRAG